MTPTPLPIPPSLPRAVVTMDGVVHPLTSLGGLQILEEVHDLSLCRDVE